MPKHRRRKNQRLLDSKSARNSKLKSQQQKSQNPSEQGDLEADLIENFDEEVQESQPGSSRQSSVHQESVEEDEEDEATKAAGTEIQPTNKHDNDSVADTDAISEPLGVQPEDSQTQVMPDVAGSNDHQQHQPVAVEQEAISISESTVEDRSSSCHQISDKRVNTEESKTGSKHSTEIAAEPPTEDEPTLAGPPGTAETKSQIDAKEAESVVVAETAPSDDLKASQPNSITEETRSRSQSVSESSDTSTLKDVGGVEGGVSEGCVSSSRSSPERKISKHENATICDITTTAMVTATEKAFDASSNLLICDNANGTILDNGSNQNTNEVRASEDEGVKGECNEKLYVVDPGNEISEKDQNESSSALSQAASSLTETMTRLCCEILTENEMTETPPVSSVATLEKPSSIEEHNSTSISSAQKVTEDMINVTEDMINATEISPPNNTLSTSTANPSLYSDRPFKEVSSVDLPNEKPERKEKPFSLPNSDTFIIASTDSVSEPPKSPIRHPIVQEVVSILFPTRVESPRPMRSKQTKAGPLAKSKSLDDDDIMIQEMSDTSSTGDLTDNQPLVSEASESEADTDTATSEFEETLDPRILSVLTLPLDISPAPDGATSDSSETDESRNQLPDVKIRRARNRAALEMHFLPQFLNPRYLDSIKEENSDNSDLDSKSPTRYHSTSSLGDLEDEVFGSASLKERRSSAPSTPKADAVFPKSSLDFSQKHKHSSNLKSPQTGVIREESPCFVVETKIIEPAEAVEERCSEWTTKLIATSSDAAEVVYIDSASSSSSDLMELDYTDSTIPSDTNDDDSSETVHIHTPTIEATEDANSIFGDPEKTPTREIPEIVEKVLQRLENAALEEKLLNDLKNDYEEPPEHTKPNEFQHHDYNANHLKDYCEQPVANYAVSCETTATESTLNSNNLTESFSSNCDTLTSASSLSEKQLLRGPDVGQSAVESETLIYNKSSSSNSEPQSSTQKIDFKIGGPCSINMFASLYSPLTNNNNSEGVSLNPVVSSTDSSKLVFNEIINERGELVRQDSSGSHCSGQSQNTVIHKGSSNEFSEAGQVYHADSLRQLCLDTLQNMPYGKVVLEELATVAETLNTLTDKHQIEQELKLRELKKIQEMPYPRPELPKIGDLIVPKRPDAPASYVKLMQALPAKLPSPPPPPVPDRPKIDKSWIGVPTEQDPNVLVCLSPAQQDYMNNNTKNQKSRQEPTPDVLLDMHRKFVERRGYHELPSEVVDKIDQRRFSTEKLSQVVSSPQLRKSSSPPPVPPPPATNLLTGQTNTTANISPPQNSHTNSERDDDRVTDDEHTDQNKHRLLAIIRDSKQSFSSNKQTTQEKVENLKIINNSQQLSSSKSQETDSDVKISEKSDEILSNSSDRQPPQVPPRTSSSDPRLHGASSSTPQSNAASTPRSNPTSDMSASTGTSFDSSFWDNPFNFDTSDFRKRFSNIETTSPFCSQLMQTQPKRFSAVETTTSTSEKRIENGKVVLDISDTSKEKVVSGDELPSSETILNGERKIGESFPSSFKVKADNDDRKTAPQPSQQQPQQQQSQQRKLFPSEAPKTEWKTFEQKNEQHESRQEQHESTKTFNQMFENRSNLANGTTPLSQEKKQDNFAYDEFRQRAKDSAAERAKSEFLERQNYLLKDFDELTKLINKDLFTTERTSKVSKTETTSTIKEPQKTGAEFAGSVKNTQSSSTQESLPRMHTVPIQVEGERKVSQQHVENKTQFETKEHKVYNVPIAIERTAKPEQQPKSQFPCNATSEPKARTIPIQVEQEQVKRNEQFPVKNGDNQQRASTFKAESTNYKKSSQKEETRERTIPIQFDGQPVRPHSSLGTSYTSQSERNQREELQERTIPIQVESQYTRPNSSLGSPNVSTQTSQLGNRRQRYFSERRLSSQDLDEWMKYVEDLGASSENITKPLMKEVELCTFGRRSNIRAPRIKEETGETMTSRFSQSTSNLSSIASDRPYSRTGSMIDSSPSPFIRPGVARQTSVPKEVFSSQIDYIRQKEAELREEFDRLESDRRRVMEEMNEMAQRNRLRKDVFYHRSCRLPTLSEEEAFRQQMHDEWLNKVAEREERRMQKIIKVTGSSDAPEVPSRSYMSKAVSDSNISDEFLRRVKERRSKLAMPSDSDWESGAESQPAPRTQQERSPAHVKVIQGQSECDFKNLPPHLREFAEITNQMIEQHYHEEQVSSTTERKTVTESSSSSGAGVAKKDGVWTPNDKTQSSSTVKTSTASKSGPTSSSTQTPPPPPPPPVWSPQPSPTPGRKEFRPVKFESPVLPRKYTAQRQDSNPVSPPWTNGNSKPLYNTQSSSCTNLTNTGNYYSGVNQQQQPQQQQQYQQHNLCKSESVGGNLAPRPTGASYTETNRPQIPKDNKPAFVRPNEVVYQLKNEYMSEPESEYDRPRKMAQLARRQFDGIGPTTKEGMPIVLRSEVKENNQHQWYKRMYNTLHKAKNDGRYPYRANGYMSEPEPNYDSDYSTTTRYHTLDRRRIPSTGSYQEERTYGTMPNPVRSSTGSYKNQPGRIENYIPGRSSVSDKEKKEWWDEVMDIFDGHLEQQKLSSNYTEGYLSRALKEEGYESDPNVVFKKRDAPQFAPLSPIEQKQVYRNVQAGGEPPLQGFKRPAPEKPKESPRRYVEGDVNIHYKSPIRYEYKDAIPEEELARKQAESMKQLYSEERRRKYLQELEDMSNRRHTDNFIPTQKSPIPLNRYDDFPTEVSPKSPAPVNLSRTVARALYNFQGQTARELSFKKGDVIYIRKQIDKNWYEGEHNAMVGLLPVNYVEVINKEGLKPIPQKKPSEGQARAKYNFPAASSMELSLNKGELVTLIKRVDDNWFEGKIANRKGIFPVSYVEVLTDIGTEDNNNRLSAGGNNYGSAVANKPMGPPSSRTLFSTSNISPTLDQLRASINHEYNHVTNGGQHPNGILRETKTSQKTEVLHIDTNSEPRSYRAIYKYNPQNNDELELLEGDIVKVLEKCDDGWYVGTSQRTGHFGTFPGNYVQEL